MGNRFLGFLYRVSKVIRYVAPQFVGPRRFSHIVHNHTKMAEIERDIFDPRCSEYDRLSSGMGKTKFVKDIRVFVGDVRKQDLRLLNLLPNLLHLSW